MSFMILIGQSLQENLLVNDFKMPCAGYFAHYRYLQKNALITLSWLLAQINGTTMQSNNIMS